MIVTESVFGDNYGLDEILNKINKNGHKLLYVFQEIYEVHVMRTTYRYKIIYEVKNDDIPKT